MNARRAKKVESQRGLRKKTVPLGEGKLGVYGAENFYLQCLGTANKGYSTN